MNEVAILRNPMWAATAAGIGLLENWRNYLKGQSHLQRGSSVFHDLEDLGPIGVIPDLAVPYYERGGALGRLVSGALLDDLQRLGKFFPRRAVFVATSHGDSGPLIAAVQASVCGEGVSTQVLHRDQFVAGLRPVGPVTTIGGACASAVVALELACLGLRENQFDAAVLIAVDIISKPAYVGFRQVGAFSRNGARPFDAERDGMSPAEGIAVLCVARSELALRCTNSEFTPAAFVAGVAQNCDAANLVEPSSAGVKAALRNALDQAEASPKDVGAVYWHGTGTRQNDAVEAAVALELFPSGVPSGTSLKGAIGHTMGASSGLSILSAVCSLQTGLLPPCAGLRIEQYPELNIVKSIPAQVNPGCVLVNSLGFGGINGCVVLASVCQ